MRICFLTAHVATRHHTMTRAIGMGPPLARLGHAVTVVAEDHPDNRELLGSCEGVETVFVHRTSLVGDMRRKSAIVEAGKYDVVHSCGFDVRTTLTRRARRQAFWIIDHVEKTSALPGMRSTKRLAWRALESWAIKAADATIAASRYLEMTIRARMFATNQMRPLLWLPYAVHASVPRQIDALRPRTVSGMCRTILYAGGLYEGYGVHALVEAVSRLPPDSPEWKLLILGTGPERDRLAAAVDAAGMQHRVVLAGYLPMSDYLATLAKADVLVSPMHDTEADWARCPSKLYFYVATRKPIVTAPIGENCEVLGVNGFYYEPGNPAAMAVALRRALAAAGSDSVPFVDPVLHTWDARAARYENWLTTALQNRS